MRRTLPLTALILLSCGNLTPYDEDGDIAGLEPEETGCGDGDPYETINGQGDDCAVAADLGELTDDGASLTFTGILHSEEDADWFVVHAADLPGDEARGWEDFRLAVAMTSGASSYQFRVERGVCGAEEPCLDFGYDAYTWFIEDTEGDEYGELPADPQACGVPPLDVCSDWSGDYLIEVLRIDGIADCTPYTIEVTNGVW